MKKGTYLVGAGLAAQPRGQSDTTRQEENGVQDVQNYHDNGVARPVDINRCRDEVDQRDHGEDGSVHGVIDRGRVS